MSRVSRAVALLLLAVAVPGCGMTTANATPVVMATRPAGMTVDCGDVAEEPCTNVAATYGEMQGDRRAIGISMRCDVSTCTSASGRVVIGLLSADGVRMSHGTTWGSEPAGGLSNAPQAAPAVAPQCVGVPNTRCFEMARTGDVPMGAPAVSVVTVRCITPRCTETGGDGETTITFDDGTRSIVGWTYGG